VCVCVRVSICVCVFVYLAHSTENCTDIYIVLSFRFAKRK